MHKIVVAIEDINYARLLKVAMASANLTATQLAESVNISRATIYSYLRDRGIPDIQVASAIADATGQPLEFFKI